MILLKFFDSWPAGLNAMINIIGIVGFTLFFVLMIYLNNDNDHRR